MSSTGSRHRPAAGTRRARGGRIALGLAALAFAGAALWLLSHTTDRSAHFSDRRGAIIHIETGPEISSAEGYISQSVRVSVANGLDVDFRVLRPATANGPLPVLVLLGGHRTGRDAVDLIGDPQGMVVAALDYPYEGPERPRGIAQVLRSIPAIQQGLLDTPPAASVALDWLLDQAWADPDRVELMGVSLGVPFAAVAGALDSRFRRVWLIHGGTDNRAWIANRLEKKIPQRLFRESTATLLHLLAYGATFRTERWSAQIAPRPVVIVGATDDEQMPAANVRQLHAATGEPKELLWTEGRHVGRGRPEVIRQLLGLVRSRFESPDPETAPRPPSA